MDKTRATSPSATTSRASSTAATSVDLDSAPEQLSNTAPLTAGSDDQQITKHKQLSNARSNFMPHQMLMQTTISIECGKDPTSAPIIIHEEILRYYSKPFNQSCDDAKVQRTRYADCQVLLKGLGSHLFPEVTAKQFEKDRLELKVIPLLLQISTQYPLKSYQRAIKEAIDGALDEEVSNKNVKPASVTTGPGGAKTKEKRDMTRTASLDTRLKYLNSQDVRTVAEQLYATLHHLDKQEKSKAQTSTLVAVAQKRILLPDTDETTVQLLVQWIYYNTLDVCDASQTYALMSLANKLGVETLRELCLSTLASGLTNTLQAARVAGRPLTHLLGYGSGPANPLLETLFNSVFLEKNPTKRLMVLVINAIADDLDKELWTHVGGALSHELALQLLEVMVLRRSVKNERPPEVHLKMEAGDVATGQLLLPGADAHNPTRVAEIAFRKV